MNELQPTISSAQSPHTLSAYVVGFIFSLVLTIIAYISVTQHLLSEVWLIAAILVLAFLQLIVQMTFFLHLNHESKPRWNSFLFFTTLIGIGILVIGSLWIMNHLNYNMSPTDMSTFIIHDEGMQQ